MTNLVELQKKHTALAEICDMLNFLTDRLRSEQIELYRYQKNGLKADWMPKRIKSTRGRIKRLMGFYRHLENNY